MRFSPVAAIGILLCLPLPAQADWSARVVARTSPDEPFRTVAVQARVGEPVELAVVLIGPEGRVYGNLQEVALRRRARRPTGPLPEGCTVQWLRVVPRLRHVDFPPPNPGNDAFSNNVLFGPDHGEWLGYDRLEYETLPFVPTSVAELDGERLVVHGLGGEPLELRWGADLRPGDLITINYEGTAADSALPRSWDHVGALLGDSSNPNGADGILDANDGLRHVSLLGLTDAPLSSQGRIRFRVWRWKE